MLRSAAMTDETPAKRGRPATGQTPVQTFRIPQELIDEARAVAKARGESLTAVVTAALTRYVARHRAGAEPRRR